MTAPGDDRTRAEPLPLLAGLHSVRRQLWLVLLVAALTVGAALGSTLVIRPGYEAVANLVATPVSRDDPAFVGLPVIRESSDPTRDVSTLTAYVTTPEVEALAVRELLAAGVAPADVAAAEVGVEPVAASYIVSVVVSSPDPRIAAQVANAYAQATVGVRREQLSNQLEPRIVRAQEALGTVPAGPESAEVRAGLVEQISQLQMLRGAPDPSLQVLNLADPEAPPTATGPARWLVLGASLLVGLVLGVVAAVLLGALRPARLSRESALRDRFPFPVLGRVPRVRRRTSGPLQPHHLSADAVAAYGRLAGELVALRGGGPGCRSVAVTGPSSGGGRTTTALAVALALADEGHEVLLVDGDPRRPALSRAAPDGVRHGVSAVLAGEVPLAAAVVPSSLSENLSLLLVHGPDGSHPHALNPGSVRHLLRQAAARWSFVVVDAVGLDRPREALPVVTQTDDVLVVVRRGHTPLAALRSLSDVVERQRTGVRGFVVVDARPADVRAGLAPERAEDTDDGGTDGDTDRAGDVGGWTGTVPAQAGPEDRAADERASEVVGRPTGG